MRTEHGDNIASQINGTDAYGRSEPLTVEDIQNIIDEIHTHLIDTHRDTSDISMVIEACFHELLDLDEKGQYVKQAG